MSPTKKSASSAKRRATTRKTASKTATKQATAAETPPATTPQASVGAARGLSERGMMNGNLDEALQTLLADSLPSLFGGAQPRVQASLTSDLYELDAGSTDAVGGEARPDDQTDTLPFDPQQPAGPYMLSKPPMPGPRRIRLTTTLGDRIALREDEIVWDTDDSRRFTLALRPERDLTGANGVQALYSIVAVFVKLKFGQNFALELQSADAARLEQAEALVLAVITLNRQQLIESSLKSFTESDYGARVEIKTLELVRGTASEANKRLLHFRAEVELKATRALTADEGKPIERIRTAGRPLDPRRPVDIRIDVEA